MTTYKDIHGTKVEVRTDDPANPVNGQVWYNSGTLKGFKSNPVGAWATGGALNTGGIFGSQNGAGTQTAGLVGGRLQEAGPSPGQKANTEAYNGSSWTELNDLNLARNAAAMGGTQTSALLGGGHGDITANTESWNGTSWTEVANLNTARGYFTGSIESNSGGIAYGGITPAGSAGVAITELWNGSGWTEVNDLNTARRSNSGVGTSSNGFAMGGYSTTLLAVCETWNGTSWTEVADQSTAGGGAAFGVYNNAVKAYGNNTELWNGTAWSEGANSSSSASNRSGVGTSSAAGFKSGGEPPNVGITTTEEWNQPVTTTVSFTVS